MERVAAAHQRGYTSIGILLLFPESSCKLIAMSHPHPSPRVRAGETIRAERKRREWSVEAAARAGGIGHMTWRKIESGKSVHDQSLYAVDRAFEWTNGHTIGAVHGEYEILAPVPRESSRDPSDHTLSLKLENKFLSRDYHADLEKSLSGFPKAYESLEDLAVPELNMIAEAAHRLAAEYGSKISRIRKLLEDIPHINWQDIAVSNITDDNLRTRCIEAWETYMREYEKITDIKSSIASMYAQPVSIMTSLNNTLIQAQEASQRIKEAAARFYELGEEGGALRTASGTNTQG